MLLRTRQGLIEFGRARFHPRDVVTRLVRQLASTDAGVRYLRGALSEGMPAGSFDDLEDEDLVPQVISRVVEGTLSFVFLRAPDAPAPAFTVEGDAAVVATDNKNKAGDVKPAPEVPPEYPKLARTEADQVVESTSKLSAKLANLMFGTFGRPRRPSTIARQLVITAQEQGARILSARQTTDVALYRGKWPGGGLDRPRPAVPVEYNNAARSTGQTAKVAIDKLSASLTLADPTKTGKPAPSLPSTYVQVASGTADRTKGAIVSLGASMGGLLHTGPFVRVRNPVPSDDGG